MIQSLHIYDRNLEINRILLTTSGNNAQGNTKEDNNTFLSPPQGDFVAHLYFLCEKSAF